MDELILISIRFNGGDNFVDHFKIPYNISWADFEAMMCAQFDSERISVSYLDTDNDEVSISSEEELGEAFRVANQCKNTLQLTVLPLAAESVVYRMSDSGYEAPQAQSEPQRAPSPEPEPLELREICEVDTPIALPDVPHALPVSEAEPVALETVTDVLESSTDTSKDSQDDLVTPQIDTECQVMQGGLAEGHVTQEAETPGHVTQEAETEDPVIDETEPCHVSLGVGASSFSEQQLPYSDFVFFMTKLKKELRTEIVRDVTRKTVKHVLKGLDGAVIESLHGSSGQDPAVKSPLTPPRSSHPVYVHDGVFCDNCNNTIVGARYKCGNCLDYDLCEDCEALGGVHDRDHVFVKLRRPARRVGVREGMRKPLLRSVLYRPHKRAEEKPGLGTEEVAPVDNEINTRLESKMRDKVKKHEKQKRKEEKKMAKLLKKEEKLKRRLESHVESPYKRERLDLMDRPSTDSTTVRYDFYKVMMSARFLHDVSIPDGTTVQPGTKMQKSWMMKNDGDGGWSDSTKLKLLWGNIWAPQSEVSVPHLQPGEEGVVTVELVAPQEPGPHQSHWKLFEHGMQFGHRIWCSVLVQPKEILEPAGTDSLKLVASGDTADTDLGEQVKPEEKSEDSDTQIFTRLEAEDHLTEVQSTKHGDQSEQEVQEQEVLVDNQSEKSEDSESYVYCRTEEIPTEQESKPEEMAEVRESLEVDLGAMARLSLNEEQVPTAPQTGDDLLTFELLDNIRGPPLLSQTATPNNTPLDLSPPKSPAPEQEDVKMKSTVSSSSSVEVVSGGEPDDVQQQAEHIQQYVEERMANLGVKPDIDLESISSLSDSEEEDEDDSSLSDSDYIIVPFPDCFDMNKPVTRSMVTSYSSIVTETDDNHNTLTSVETMATSGSLSGTATSPTPTPSQTERDSSPSPTPEAPVRYQPGGPTDTEPYEEPTETPDSATATQTAPSVTIVIEEEKAQEGAVSSLDIQPEEGVVMTQIVADGAASAAGPTTPENQVGEEDVVPETEPSSGEAGIEGEFSEETEIKEPLPDDSPLPSNVKVVRVPRGSQQGQNRPGEFANQLVTTAVHAASKAAGQAYVTVKAVYQTWQGKQPEEGAGSPSAKYKPPKSSWKPPAKQWTPPKSDFKPPQSDFKPPQSDFKPPQSNFKPPQSDFKPPQSDFKPPEPDFKLPEERVSPPPEAAVLTPKQKGPMDLLMEMGFCNRELNSKLLKKHNNDVQRVIQDLLADLNSDWASMRH